MVNYVQWAERMALSMLSNFILYVRLYQVRLFMWAFNWNNKYGAIGDIEALNKQLIVGPFAFTLKMVVVINITLNTPEFFVLLLETIRLSDNHNLNQTIFGQSCKKITRLKHVFVIVPVSCLAT